MKIFSAQQIRHCDQQTIREEGITSTDLMERAAKACLHWITNHYDRGKSFLVICGMGNNGGDGLALTRLLIEEGYHASALVLKHKEAFSGDASKNLKRLHQITPQRVSILNESDELNGISTQFILIDALFGTGINRPVTGWVSDFINIMNTLPHEKIAIDMPSGLPADTLPAAGAAIFSVHHTLSFQLMKRSLLHPEGAAFSGSVSILDIGLSASFIAQNPSQYQITDLSVLKFLYRPRKDFSHKGTYGTATLIGGSYGMMGAVALATLAALRSGAGKVKALAPHCGCTTLQTLCPEALFQKGGDTFIEKMEVEAGTTVGIGPGLGLNPLTKRALSLFLKQATQPLVLDADALNIIAESPEEMLMQIPAGSLLTPHPGEFKRLFGTAANTMECVEAGRNQAMRLNSTIVLKGHHTTVLLPDGSCFYNVTGNAGMAKGGSGDVLTGLLTGLMAQGYSATDAAVIGVWLHGKAGDLAAGKASMETITAQDICAHLGEAFHALLG